MRLPNKIHFYMQNHLPDPQELYNIANWSLFAPEHMCCLWLSSFTLAAHLKEITNAFKEHWEIYGRSNVDMQLNSPQEVMLTIQTRFKGIRRMMLYDFKKIRPLSSTQVVHNESRIWDNPKGVSNIIRLWILNQEGGIFLDQNTKPAKPVP